MGKEAEVVAKGEQSILMDLCFSFVIQVGKDSSVLTQQTMDIPDKIV